jgi:outer membrane protein OmpA-like peptidoglycan-associated protein
MKNLLTAIVCACFALLIGCSPKPTPMDNSLAALEAAKKSQEASLKTLEMISKQAEKDAEAGTIAESANSEIQEFVSVETARIKAQQEAIEAAQQEAADLKSKKSKKSRQQVLDQVNSAVVTATDQIRILDQKTEVVVDFLGNTTFSKSEIGALFSPGEYRLIPEQVKEGEKLFRPIVEKLYTFADKYKGSFKSLKGEIIVTGYSDATPIEKGSRLYRDLAGKLQTSGGAAPAGAAPGRAELNQKLSELRATAVKELLTQIISKRNKNNSTDALDISIQVLGRGEQIPRGLPANIADNDRRRRVVTFYWVVLPGL